MGTVRRVENGDDLVDPGALTEAHGGDDAGAVAEPYGVGQTGGDPVVAETLIARKGADVGPLLDDRLPGDSCAAAAVGGADGLLQGETVAEGGDFHGEMVSGEW